MEKLTELEGFEIKVRAMIRKAIVKAVAEAVKEAMVEIKKIESALKAEISKLKK